MTSAQVVETSVSIALLLAPITRTVKFHQGMALLGSNLFNSYLSCSFNINPISGAITVKSQLDRETYAQYSLSVQAKDSGVPSLSSMTVVMVTIDDFNDNAPVFSERIFYGHIREDASTGSKVLKVCCGGVYTTVNFSNMWTY